MLVKRAHWIVVYALGIGLLAGCLDPQSSPGGATTGRETSTSAATSSTGSSSANLPVINSSIPEKMSATDCTGPDTLVYGPTEVFSQAMPPGWEEGEDEPLTDVFLRLFECQKISWGPFERGPVTMLAEIHGSLNAPQSCLEDHPHDAVAYRWLASLWFSDADIANWVAATYGAPVYYGEFETAHEMNPALETHTWSWGLPNQERSYVTMRDVAVSDNHPGPFTEWWFWFNGQGISSMDSVMLSMSDDTSAPLVDGHMAPPMMFANATGQSGYAAVADWFPEKDFDGVIQRFGDLECKVPS